MSKEYIEREEVIKILEHYDLSSGSTLGCHSGAIECAIFAIKMLPAADVVPVVRCKDCRHCETDYVHEGEYTCFYTGAMGLTLDDFCSKAEGKDEHDKSNNDN